jgi:hypothetical protein
MASMARRHASLGLALLASIALVPSSQRAVRAQDAPQPTASPSVAQPRLPRVEAQGQKSRVQGKIVRSSRGRKGPVRLQVERADGSKVTVLVAPDDVCERLGLSLRTGETVDVAGALLKTKQPILVATAFTVDGKTIAVRDGDGKLVAPPGGASPPAAAAQPTKATVSGGAAPSPAD